MEVELFPAVSFCSPKVATANLVLSLSILEPRNNLALGWTPYLEVDMKRGVPVSSDSKGLNSGGPTLYVLVGDMLIPEFPQAMIEPRVNWVVNWVYHLATNFAWGLGCTPRGKLT